MNVITPGHRYELDGFEGEGSQTLQFIHKEPGEGDELVTASEGTTNEEVLAVLIDRMEFLNAKFPCRENELTIRHLKDALAYLDLRTSKRKARGVEGTHQP